MVRVEERQLLVEVDPVGLEEVLLGGGQVIDFGRFLPVAGHRIDIAQRDHVLGNRIDVYCPLVEPDRLSVLTLGGPDGGDPGQSLDVAREIAERALILTLRVRQPARIEIEAAKQDLGVGEVLRNGPPAAMARCMASIAPGTSPFSSRR